MIHDHKAREDACEECGTVVQLGAQKSDAARFVRNTEFTSRELLLDWCRKKCLAAAEHAQVDTKYSPDLRRLESQTLKTRDQDCRVWFTAEHIPERAQMALRLRIPVMDEWNQLDEFIDLDIYFPKDQVAEMANVLSPPAKNGRIMKLQFMTLTRRHLERAVRECLAAQTKRGKTRRG